MAFKTRKQLSGAEPEQEREAERSAPEEEAAEPYKVFNTKEEFDAAVADRSAEKKEKEPDRQPAADSGRDNRIALWQRDAYMLSLVVPGFDFEAALKNDTFRRILAGGGTVFEAYAAVTKPASGKRSEIFQNAQSSVRGTGDSGVNPAKLSGKEFKRYIENIRNS